MNIKDNPYYCDSFKMFNELSQKSEEDSEDCLFIKYSATINLLLEKGIITENEFWDACEKHYQNCKNKWEEVYGR